MRSQMLRVLVLAVLLVVTSLVDTGFGALDYPLRELLKRAETVLVVRMSSRTDKNAVFEVAHVLRGDPKLQKFSLSRKPHSGLGLPDHTRGLLLFSQGDNYRGEPKGSYQVGQSVKAQRIYRGWILMDGPGESKEELDRLKELVKENPYKPDLHGKSSDKGTNRQSKVVPHRVADGQEVAKEKPHDASPSVLVLLSMDKTTFRVGDRMELTRTLKNETGKPVEGYPFTIMNDYVRFYWVNTDTLITKRYGDGKCGGSDPSTVNAGEVKKELLAGGGTTVTTQVSGTYYVFISCGRPGISERFVSNAVRFRVIPKEVEKTTSSIEPAAADKP